MDDVGSPGTTLTTELAVQDIREKQARRELDALQTGTQLLHQDYTRSQAYVYVIGVCE